MSRLAPCMAASAISVWMCVRMGECGMLCKALWVVRRLESRCISGVLLPFTIMCYWLGWHTINVFVLIVELPSLSQTRFLRLVSGIFAFNWYFLKVQSKETGLDRGMWHAKKRTYTRLCPFSLQLAQLILLIMFKEPLVVVEMVGCNIWPEGNRV